MTSVRRFSQDDAKLMWQVLYQWSKHLAGQPTDHVLEGHVRRFYRPLLSDHCLTFTFPQQTDDLTSSKFGWLVGQPLSRQKSIPVVTAKLGDYIEDTWCYFTLRVALLSVREDGTIAAEGWRFEFAEPWPDGTDRPAHPYAHAQAITGWTKDLDCLLHNEHGEVQDCVGIDAVEEELAEVLRERHEQRSMTLVKHPAFPLGVTTMTGLALSVVATLYGSQGAAQICANIPKLRAPRGDLERDLVSLSMLRS